MLKLAGKPVKVDFNDMPFLGQEISGDLVGFPFGSFGQVRRSFPSIGNIVCCQFGLPVAQRPDRSLWLNQSDEDQAGVFRVEHAQIEGYPVRLPIIQEAGIKEWCSDLIPGGSDNRVIRLLPAIHEMNGLALDTMDTPAWVDLPMADLVEQFGVDGRVGLDHIVFRGFQSVIFIASDLESQREFAQGPDQEFGDPLQSAIEGIGWFTQEELGHNVLGSANADPHKRSHPADLYGTVATGITGANYQHTLIPEGIVVLVGMSMQVVAGKIILPFRMTRHMVVAIGDQQKVGFFRHAICQVNPPSIGREGFDLLYRSVELNIGKQAKVFCVGLEVSPDLFVRRVIRICLWHGEIQELGQGFGADDMRGLAHAGMRGLLRIDPVATYPVILIKADHIGQAGLQKILDTGDA